MNQRKMYRILLTERDSIFTDIALDAANSNGAKYVPIGQLLSPNVQPAWRCCRFLVLIENKMLSIYSSADNSTSRQYCQTACYRQAGGQY